jgi:hypothetical protein
MWFSLSILGAFGLTLAPLPWSAAGVALVVGAIVLGVVGIRRARRVPGGRAAVTSFGIGLAFAAMLLLYFGLLAVQWPAQWEYQRCQGRALTEEAADACVTEYRRDSQSILNRVGEGLR